MAVTPKAASATDPELVTGFGDGSKLQQILANIQADLAALRTAVNTHTHTENTAGAYTQNATTGAPNANTAPALNTLP